MKFNDAPSTRASFLHQLQDPDDQRAWEAFVKWYKPAIDQWCRQWLQDADADDVCSAVLLKVWTKIRDFRYDPAGRFRGWLRRLARNEMLDHCRALSRRPGARGSGNAAAQRTLEQIEATDAETPLDQELERLEAEEQRLRQAMDRVQARAEDRTWQAWLLTVQQGGSAREAADALGMNVASVYKAKQRINLMIREEYLRDADAPAAE